MAPPIRTVKQPYKTNDGTILYMGTSTVVEVDANGKYVPNSAVISLRLYDTTSSILGTDFKTVAIRNAGEPWRLTQDGNGNYVAGLDLQRTLADRNSIMNKNLNNHVSNALQAPLQGVPAGQVNPNTQSSANTALGLPPTTGTARPDPTPTDQGTTSTPLTEENLETLQKGIAGRDIRTDYGNLYYPKDIASTKSDAIKFTMIRYGTKTYNAKTLGFGERTLSEGTEEIKGRVVMSIQPTIGDYNSANWSGETMGMLGATAAGASLEIIDTGSPDNIGRAIGNTLDKEPGLKDAIIAITAQEAAGAKGLLSRLTGAMFNNNLELLFQGPQLRQFTFNFKMSPRYKEEAEDVRKIIRFFKQGSAVQRSTTNLFLKAPNVFKLEYLYRENGEDNPHKSLNKIKTCALVNMSVDYTPTGSYMTFAKDGSMVSYTLSLTFNELEPVYEDEYSRDDLQEIGY